MTEGISKEVIKRLISYGEATCQLASDIDLLKVLLDECVELDQWLPIDENTPKDRRLLLKFVDDYVSVNDLEHITGLVATHYKELPPNPKE